MVRKRFCIVAATAILGAATASAAQESSSFADPVNARFDRAANGTSGVTGSEVTQCLSYWSLWQEAYEDVVPEAERANMDVRLQPEATAAAVAYYERLFSDAFDAADAWDMQQRLKYIRQYEKEADEKLDAWDLGRTDLGFFGWLGGCGVR